MDFIQPKRKQRLSTKIEKVYFESKTIRVLSDRKEW
jgi:hypothetical protein